MSMVELMLCVVYSGHMLGCPDSAGMCCSVIVSCQQNQQLHQCPTPPVYACSCPTLPSNFVPILHLKQGKMYGMF